MDNQQALDRIYHDAARLVNKEPDRWPDSAFGRALARLRKTVSDIEESREDPTDAD